MDHLLHSPGIFRRLALGIGEAEIPGVVAAVLSWVIVVAAFADVVAAAQPLLELTERQRSPARRGLCQGHSLGAYP